LTPFLQGVLVVAEAVGVEEVKAVRAVAVVQEGAAVKAAKAKDMPRTPAFTERAWMDSSPIQYRVAAQVDTVVMVVMVVMVAMAAAAAAHLKSSRLDS
jgi:hypothetical protein